MALKGDGKAAAPATHGLIEKLLPQAAVWTADESAFEAKAAQVSVLPTKNEDIHSLQELITYGLKGLSDYSKHANALLQEDAFLSPNVAKVLVENFGIAGIGTVEDDLKLFFPEA